MGADLHTPATTCHVEVVTFHRRRLASWVEHATEAAADEDGLDVDAATRTCSVLEALPAYCHQAADITEAAPTLEAVHRLLVRCERALGGSHCPDVAPVVLRILCGLVASGLLVHVQALRCGLPALAKLACVDPVADVPDADAKGHFVQTCCRLAKEFRGAYVPPLMRARGEDPSVYVSRVVQVTRLKYRHGPGGRALPETFPAALQGARVTGVYAWAGPRRKDASPMLRVECRPGSAMVYASGEEPATVHDAIAVFNAAKAGMEDDPLLCAGAFAEACRFASVPPPAALVCHLGEVVVNWSAGKVRDVLKCQNGVPVAVAAAKLTVPGAGSTAVKAGKNGMEPASTWVPHRVWPITPELVQDPETWNAITTALTAPFMQEVPMTVQSLELLVLRPV